MASVSYPSTPGRRLPLLTPVPLNSQWDALVTTMSEGVVLETPLYSTPIIAPSGRMFLHSVVRKRGSVGLSSEAGSSLYAISVRSGSPEEDGSKRIWQYDMFPPRNPRWTPASRPRSTLSRIAHDQYSSCPMAKKTLCERSKLEFWWVSMSVAYVTSYPCLSCQRTKLISYCRKSPAPNPRQNGRLYDTL